MAKTRRDDRGRVLKKGEVQRASDKRYMYTYTDPMGRRRFIYANGLTELREKEKKLVKDQMDGLDLYVAGKATVNDTFDRYLSTKFQLRETLFNATLSESPNLLMVTTMLEQAFAKIPNNTKLLLHSDQGWHYRHKQYVQMLQEKGICQSMSRKGNCYDNSVMENFFGHLKSELLYLQEFESIEHFKQELIEHIDYYNNRRIKAR